MKTKVLVTGGNGLCGSALKEESINYPDYDFYFATRNDADLTSEHQVRTLFYDHKPDYVIHTSAKVGGIGGNEAFHENFFYDNILMNAHMIRSCIEFKVKKLFAFSSVCVFPDNLTLLEEEKIHDGPVFESNFAYGYSKRMVDVHIRAAEKQYGIKNYVSIIPGNIFGKHDMFSIEHGHIIPSLIHKLYLAKLNNTKLEVWGDGKSLREFIYVNDLAKAILELLALDNLPNKIIISGPKEYSIKDIVHKLCDLSLFAEEDVFWNTSKPNGQRSRPSSKTRLKQLLPNFSYTDIDIALKLTWDWFKDNYPNVRMNY